MNRALVRRATAGLAAWLHEHRPRPVGAGSWSASTPATSQRRVRGGHRRGAGRRRASRSHLLPGPLPTPVLAFAVRHLGAAAGVMVTASHNPPQDNGYKVYARRRRPDRAAGRRRDLGRASTRSARWPTCRSATSTARSSAGRRRACVDAYLDARAGDAAVAGRRRATVAGRRLHRDARRGRRRRSSGCFAGAGFGRAGEVAEQVEPDPDFPTVAFPNPEEPGALDLSLADRGAGRRRPRARQRPRRRPAGGRRPRRRRPVRLADAPGRRARRAAGRRTCWPTAPARPRSGRRPVLACSRRVVAAARPHGRGRRRRLRRDAHRLQVDRPRARARASGSLFGYEEALGYCVGDLVARQGRHQRRCSRSCAELVAALGGRVPRWPTASTSSPARHGAPRHPPALVPGRGHRLARPGSPRRWPRCGPTPPTDGRRAAGRARRGPRRRRRRPQLPPATC